MRDKRFKVLVVSYPDRKFLVMRFIDPLSGRRVAKSTGTTNRREAEKIAAKLEAELEERRYRPDSKVSWEAFREKYESEVLPGLADATGRMVGTVFNAVEKILRPAKLQDLTADRLSYFQSELRAGGRAEPTIRSYLAHLAAILKWAATIGLLSAAPKIQRPKRAKASKVMKGRPITSEEFAEMLERTEKVVGEDAAESWRYFLRGLWWSGLRLGEALEVYWDREDRLCVDLSGNRPMLSIPAAFEKGNKDRLLPVAPEFAEFLQATPSELRKGRVFQPVGLRVKGAKIDKDWASRVISRVGRLANVKVNTDPKTGKIKFASAHDLRRSFGARWARRVMPQVLKELMRHESIDTTLKYYVGHDAQLTADALWSAYEQSGKTGAGSSVSPDAAAEF